MAHPVFEGLVGSDRTLVGGWVTLACEPVVERMFNIGYDYVGIDTQHTLIDPATAGRLLFSVPKDAPPALVRVPSNHWPDIGKVLDAGAAGVIVPMVNSGAEARRAVEACRYGQAGVRSIGPMRANMPYDVESLEARTACFVMVETVEAVRNIDEICATPGLAGIYVGPADLAISLGYPIGLDPMPEALLDAVRRVGSACGRAGVIAGGHFPLAHIGLLSGLGFQMFTIGADVLYIATGAKGDLATARKVVNTT